MRRPLHEVLTASAVASAVAAVISGAPSTAHALASGRSPLAAARAAATVLPGRRQRPGVVAGVGVHAVISAGWGTVLAVVLPRRHTVAWGALAGAAIAALDLELIAARTVPAVAELPQWPQWADHVVFGATVGWVLSRTDVAPS